MTVVAYAVARDASNGTQSEGYLEQNLVERETGRAIDTNMEAKKPL